MTIAASTPPTPLTHRNRLREWVRGHPVSAFAVLAFRLGWPMIAVSVQTSWADTMRPIASYVALLGAALAVTWAGGGPSAVRSFLARFLIWRFGAAREVGPRPDGRGDHPRPHAGSAGRAHLGQVQARSAPIQSRSEIPFRHWPLGPQAACPGAR